MGILDEAIAKIEMRFVDPPRFSRPSELNIWAQGYLAGTLAAVDAVEDLKEEKKEEENETN